MDTANMSGCGVAASAGGRRRDAFTVVEVMVSTVILMIITLAVIGAFSFARRSVSLTENRLASLHIAREVMETLRRESYGATLLNYGTHKQLPGYPAERGYYDVTAGVGVGESKTLTVVIEWVEPMGLEQSVSLTTVHSKGLHR